MRYLPRQVSKSTADKKGRAPSGPGPFLCPSSNTKLVLCNLISIQADYTMRTHSMFHRPAKLLAVGGLLWAALLAGPTALAQSILGSRHDLTSAGTGSIKQTSTTEVCVFCHTPYGVASLGPLWNKVARSQDLRRTPRAGDLPREAAPRAAAARGRARRPARPRPAGQGQDGAGREAAKASIRLGSGRLANDLAKAVFRVPR